MMADSMSDWLGLCSVRLVEILMLVYLNDTATTEIYTYLTHAFPTRRSSDLDDVAPRSACFNATPCGRGCTIGAMFQTTTSFLPMAKATRSEEHTSELQSLMRISYAVFCLTKKISTKYNNTKTKRIQYERKK